MLSVVLVSAIVTVAPLDEARYCGDPVRDARGQIVRSAAVIGAYRKLVACPSTLKFTGACPGWALNHTWPLVCGGCDSVSNLAWMPNVLKSGPGAFPVDRWEQLVYCDDKRRLVPMPDRGRLIVE